MFKNIRSSEEPGSILGAILNHIPVESDWKWNSMIGIEALLAVIISIYVAMSVGIAEAGLASLALASAAIVPRVNQILRINRERIWDQGVGGWTANRKSITSGTIILLAMVLVYAVFAAITDREILSQNFSFVGVTYTEQLLTPERFEHGLTFFFTNTGILILFFFLSFIFRGLGTSLALGWNAGVWSVTIVLMARTGIASAEDPLVYSLVAFAAVAPHLVIEGLAYITGSLAGIFLSRGVTLYGLRNPRLLKVLNAVIVLFVISFGIVILGAVVEHFWAPYMLRLL